MTEQVDQMQILLNELETITSKFSKYHQEITCKVDRSDDERVSILNDVENSKNRLKSENERRDEEIRSYFSLPPNSDVFEELSKLKDECSMELKTIEDEVNLASEEKARLKSHLSDIKQKNIRLQNILQSQLDELKSLEESDKTCSSRLTGRILNAKVRSLNGSGSATFILADGVKKIITLDKENLNDNNNAGTESFWSKCASLYDE